MKKEYIYRADIYCEECGDKLCEALPKPPGMDPDNEYTWDSDQYPKGPYDVSEADYPVHCAECGLFMENRLTPHGDQYVRDHAAAWDEPDSSWEEIAQRAEANGEYALAQWIRYYFAPGQ